MNVKPLPNDIVSVEDQVKSGIQLWNGMPNQECMLSNPGNEWMCYISPYAYPHINSPILIHTEQYDSFQLPYNCGCSPPFNTSSEWNFADDLRQTFNASLREIKYPNSVFSPACFSHCYLESSSFYTTAIDGYQFKDVLGNWLYDRPGVKYAIDDCVGWDCSQNCPPI